MPDSVQSTTISAAGLSIRVFCEQSALTRSLRRHYRDFLAEGEAQLAVFIHDTPQPDSAPLDINVVFREGIAYFRDDRGFIDLNNRRAELAWSTGQPVENVYYFLRVAFALLAFDAGGWLFHAAGIVREGRAYVFFGHCGAGKTTVARLSSQDVVLNDDLVVLLPPKDGRERWTVHATPFWNPTQVRPLSYSAPLAGLFRLVQDHSVFVEKINRSLALAEMITCVPIIPDDPSRQKELMTRIVGLLRCTPVHYMHFLPDDSFWSAVECSCE